MSLKQIVAPTEEPVTLQEARNFLRVDLLDDDSLISSFIRSARQRVETEVRRALVTQTWRMRADEFPSSLCDGRHLLGDRFRQDGYGDRLRQDGRSSWDAIVLPLPPLVSVSSITYVDTAGVTRTWDPSNYVVNSDREPARITPAYGVSWPSTRGMPDAVTIVLVVGYGAAAAVPDGLKNAIEMLVTHWYQNRMPVSTGAMNKIPLTVEALLDPFRWGSYA